VARRYLPRISTIRIDYCLKRFAANLFRQIVEPFNGLPSYGGLRSVRKRGSTVSGSANCKPRLCANWYGRGDCEEPEDDAKKGSHTRGRVSGTKTIGRVLWVDVHLVGFDYRIRMAPGSAQRSEGCGAGVDPLMVAGGRHAFAAGAD